MKKLLSVLLTISLTLPSLASTDTEKIENKPVEEDVEVMLATFDSEGKLVPVTEPETVLAEKAGEFEVEIPEDFPEHKPIFVVVNDSAGEGTQQVSYVDPKGDDDVEVDPAGTTAFNSYASMAKNTGIDPKDADPKQIEEFMADVKNAIKDVPPDENPAKTMERMAQALSFNPEALLNAGSHFNVPKDKLVQVAANIEKAAAPSGFNPFESLPDIDFATIAPGSHTAGLLPEKYFKKHMPKEMQDFNVAFCETCPPPGGFEYVDEKGKKGAIPPGTFMMPPGVKANPVAFKKMEDSEVIFPPGVAFGKGFPMPAKAKLPPGAILEEGFEPPEGFELPPGVMKPEGFDEMFAGRVVHKEDYEAPEGYEPPPGFAFAGKKGEFMMPPDFPLPKGVKADETLAMEFPPPKGFEPFKIGKGMELGNYEPPPEGHVFGDGFKPPKGFDPEEFGFVPPAGFVADTFVPGKEDFAGFKGDNFTAFDPFGGKFDAHATGPFVPPELADGLRAEAMAQFGDDFSEEKFQEFISGSFDAPPPPPPPEDDGMHDGDFTGDGGTTGEFHDGGDGFVEHDCKDIGDCPDDGGTFDDPDKNDDGEWVDGGNLPGTNDGFVDCKDTVEGCPTGDDGPDPNTKDDGASTTDGTHDGGTTDSGTTQPPPDDGGTVNNPPPPPPDDGGTTEVKHDEPPPPDDGGSTALLTRTRTASAEAWVADNNTKPKRVRLKATSKSRKKLKTRGAVTRSNATVNAGTKLAVTVDTDSKATKITASEGVYLVGKARAGKTSAELPLIIDPSVSVSSVKVTLAQKDNNVDVETLTVDTDDATQLTTTLDTRTIKMVTKGTDVELDLEKVTGYLLAPGTSSLKLMKAISVKGTVSDATSGQVVNFTVPAKKFSKLSSGVYTVVFQDGDSSYYGKVTIGTLKARTIKGVVKAPNGSL